MPNGECDHDSCEAASSTERANHDIMCAGKNKRLREQTFVFHKPLTNESPAKAGSRARMRGIREFKI